MVLQVREAVAVLDLEVLYRPCPANGPTWRAKLREMGGKASFPFMHDPNTGGALRLLQSIEVSQSMLPNLFTSWSRAADMQLHKSESGNRAGKTHVEIFECCRSGTLSRRHL